MLSTLIGCTESTLLAAMLAARRCGGALATTYATHFTSLDRRIRSCSARPCHRANGVESLLRDLVGEVESYDDFLVVNRKFTVLIQPSVPVPHGYTTTGTSCPPPRQGDITLAWRFRVPRPRDPGYLALPRLLVQSHGIRLFSSSERCSPCTVMPGWTSSLS